MHTLTLMHTEPGFLKAKDNCVPTAVCRMSKHTHRLMRNGTFRKHCVLDIL